MVAARWGAGRAALIAAALLAQAACQGVYSRTALAPVRDDRVVGEWQTVGDDDPFTIHREGDDYVAQPRDEKPTRFQLFRIGEALYAQSGGKPCEEFPREAECYSLGRLELAADSAQLFPFDTAAMFTASLRENFAIPYELRRTVGRTGPSSPRVENNFLLMADEPAVRAFLARYGVRFTATSRVVRYRRVKKAGEAK